MAGLRTTTRFSENPSLKQNDNKKPCRTIGKFFKPPPLKVGNFARKPPCASSVQGSLEYISESSICYKEEKKKQGFSKEVYTASVTPANDRLALLKEKLTARTTVLEPVVVNHANEDVAMTLDRTMNSPFTTLQVTHVNKCLALPNEKLAANTTALKSVVANDENKKEKNNQDCSKEKLAAGTTVLEPAVANDEDKEEKCKQGFFRKVTTTLVTPANDKISLLKGKLAVDITALDSAVVNDDNEDLAKTLDHTVNLPFTTLEEARQSWAALTNHIHRQTKLKSVFTHDAKPHETIEEVPSLDAMPLKITPSTAHSCFTQAAQDYYKLQELEEQKKQRQKFECTEEE